MKMRLRLVLPLLLFVATVAPVPAADKAPQAAFREIQWDELVPKNWDPLARFKGMDLGALSDGNSKALEIMRELRQVWDQAPTNPKMDGAAIRLAGYIVPLEQVKGDLKEFLLVPYFGACIHSPPPPANQIVHVVVERPVTGYRSMDTVWVNGTLKTFRRDSSMGVSGYRLQAAAVERYEAPARP
jgi:hypothetical protein